MNYILLIDEDEDILNIQTMVLSSFYSGKVICVRDGKMGLERVQKEGLPEIIIADHKILVEVAPTLYTHVCDNNLLVPLIICSATVASDPKDRKYPHVSAIVPRPFSIDSLSYLVKSIIIQTPVKAEYLSVKLPVLLNYVGKSFDLYMKLSETNFVKVINRGDPFTKTDSDRFLQKGVTQLHIDASDSTEFLKAYEESLNLLLASRTTDNVETEHLILAIDALASIEGISKRLGWSAETIQAAQKSIDLALKVLSKDAVIAELLKQKLAHPESSYLRHVGLLSFLTCAFSSGLGWGGESVQNKLAMACLLHDLAVDETHYNDIKSWNKRASNIRDRTAEVIKYRLHPIDASKLIQKLSMLPADIEQILLQHHEKQDGTGFPRSLTHNRIGQLSAFFMIIEDLVDFIGEGEQLEKSLDDFKAWGDSYYEAGHFKKLYEQIRLKIR